MVKNDCGQSGLWTLKLTVYQERTDETNRFFACQYNFTQKWVWSSSKMSMVKKRCDQSGDGTRKLTVFGE